MLCRKYTFPASIVLLQCTLVYTVEVCMYTDLCITITMMIIMCSNDTNMDRYWRKPLATSHELPETHTHTICRYWRQTRLATSWTFVSK